MKYPKYRAKDKHLKGIRKPIDTFVIEKTQDGVKLTYGHWTHIAANMETAIEIMNDFSVAIGKSKIPKTTK